MNWRQGQIIKIDGQRYRVEHIIYPSGTSDEGMYDLTLQRIGMPPADVPRQLVQAAMEAADWNLDASVVRVVLAAVIPDIAEQLARKVLEFCTEHNGDHGKDCGYAIAANVIAGKPVWGDS